MSANFTLILRGGVKVAVKEPQVLVWNKATGHRALLFGYKGARYVLKVTNANDVRIHKHLLTTPCAPWVCPLEDLNVAEVIVRGKPLTQPFKIMPYYDGAKGAREERQRMLTEVGRYLQDGDWQREQNTLWHEGRAYAFDFDHKDEQLRTTAAPPSLFGYLVWRQGVDYE